MENTKAARASVKGESAHLLRKADAGCKYATQTISIALDYAKDKEIRALLTKYNKRHEALKGDIIGELNARGEGEEKHPSMAAAMAGAHMKISLGISAKDSRLAELMINGCHMGIKTLYKEKHRRGGADARSRELTDELIRIEEQMMGELYGYLR